MREGLTEIVGATSGTFDKPIYRVFFGDASSFFFDRQRCSQRPMVILEKAVGVRSVRCVSLHCVQACSEGQTTGPRLRLNVIQLKQHRIDLKRSEVAEIGKRAVLTTMARLSTGKTGMGKREGDTVGGTNTSGLVPCVRVETVSHTKHVAENVRVVSASGPNLSLCAGIGLREGGQGTFCSEEGCVCSSFVPP